MLRCNRGSPVRRVLLRERLGFAVLSLLMGSPGCDRASGSIQKGGQEEPPPAPSSRPSAFGKPSWLSEPADGGRPRIALDPATRRKMKLGLRREPASDVAFGKGRLGVLTDDSLIVRDVTRFSEALRLPLAAPRALVGLADGSLFAIGGGRSLRLLPHDTKPLAVPRIILFPESSLFGDRRAPDRVWVLPALGKTLFGYDAIGGPGPLLVATEWIDLDGYDRRSFASVRDGSFIYSTPSGPTQFYGKGKKEVLSAASAGMDHGFRLMPASRPDTVWVVAEKRARLFRILAGKFVRLKDIALGAEPYDAVAEGELLAVLELLQPDDAPWTFALEVFDVGGGRRCNVSLPADETWGEDWVARMVQNRGLAMSADPPLVAVGGPTHLDVFSARDGGRVFSWP